MYSQQSIIKVGRGLENVCQSGSKTNKEKKETWTDFLFRRQCFPAVMNNQIPNSRFIEISFLHSQHYSSVKIWRMKVVLNTAAAEASCCFALISGLFDESQMYDTNNIHLMWMNKWRCLNF